MFKLLTYTGEEKRDEATGDGETERKKLQRARERGRVGKSEKDGGAEVTVVGGFISVKIPVGLSSQQLARILSKDITGAVRVFLGAIIRYCAGKDK